MMRRAVIFLCGILTLTALFTQRLYAAQKEIDSTDNNPSNYVLKNGLTLILKEDRRTPTFALSLFVRTGSATEGIHTGSGITHLIEHMIFKGTSNRSAAQVYREIKSLGGDIGAYTTFDYTSFNLQGPCENIYPLLDIFYDIIADPGFIQEELEKEKDVIKREMSLHLDDPAKHLSQQFWQTAYIVHPYRYPIIGYEEIFDRLTHADIRDYYERFYIPDNMVLVIVGDIDIPKIKDKIDRRFGHLSREKASIPALPQEPKQLATRYREIPYATAKAYLMLGFHTVSLTSKDLYALDTLALLLGEGRSSLLYENLHNRLRLVYDTRAYHYTPFQPGLFVVTATFDPDNKDKVIGEVLSEIEKIKKIPFNKKSLDKAKNQVISSYIFSKQTQGSQAADLGISKLLTGDIYFSRYYVEGIRSVDPDDILDVAKRYLSTANMTTVLLVPAKDTVKESISKTKTYSSPKREVVKRSLPNGVRVLLCEDKTLPIVSVRVTVKGGLRAEEESNNGISNLTAHMLTKGSRQRSEEKIFSSIESLGGKISAYSANNTFGLSLDIMSKDLKKGIEILADMFTHPAFKKDKLQILKEDILAEIELIDDDIFASTEKRLREKLFSGHPYGWLSIGSLKTIKKIRRREIIDFYKVHCVGSNIVVSVCGDINGGQVYRLIKSKFKGIRAGAPPAIREVPLAKLTEPTQVKEEMDKDQSVVMIGFRGVGVDSPDRDALQILSSIFSGGAGRLFATLRQQKALAYTTGTFGMRGIDTGSFIFYVSTSSENVDYARDEIMRLINGVCEGDITEEEIDSAKKLLISEYQIGLQTAGAFALQTALDETYGLGYDNYLRYPERINSITREEIIQVANKYLTVENSVVSITTPKER